MTASAKAASCRLPPAVCLLPSASCLLPSASCRLLPAACPSGHFEIARFYDSFPDVVGKFERLGQIEGWILFFCHSVDQRVNESGRNIHFVYPGAGNRVLTQAAVRN